MTELQLQPRVSVTTINGNHIAAYVMFRQGITAHETFRFSHTEDPTASLLIDVDRDNIPIGMEISAFGEKDVEVLPGADIPKDKIILESFSFASQMAGIARRRYDKALVRQGDEIIREMVATLPFLQDDEGPAACDSTLTGCPS